MPTLAYIIANLGLPELGILAFIFLVWAIPFWFIFKRIGWHPSLALLVAIPGVALIYIYLVAFAPWKTPAAKNTENS